MTYDFTNGERHERHGVCRRCYYGVHEYPFGISHVSRPQDRHEPDVRWTCCEEHDEKEDR